jgi:muramoyltetrapeptide carboxypeptidase
MHETANTLLPTTLKKGDTIGLAPLAGPFSEETYQQGVTILHEHGFKVKTMHPTTPSAYLAGSDRERLDIFHTLWKDPEVAAVLSVRGGYGTIRLLNNLDFELIKTHPKPLIGFSDISGFCNVIEQQTGLVTFHGPNLTTLCQCDKESLYSFFHTLTRMVPFEIKDSSLEVIRRGTATAPLAGGNLTTINQLLGTPFELNFDGTILILEDINEPPYALDRLFYQLHLAGKLSKLKGLILGNFSGGGGVEDLWQMVLDLVAEHHYPIWGNFPTGHKEQNRLWPIGAVAKMDSETAVLSFTDRVMNQ